MTAEKTSAKIAWRRKTNSKMGRKNSRREIYLFI